MKINTKSWHYRLKSRILGRFIMHQNLCAYFWGCVLSILLPAILVSLILFLVVFFIYIMFTEPGFINICLIVLSVIGCFALPPIGIYWFRRKTIKQYLVPGEEVVVEFIKAKKSKLCPLIEYY